MNKDDLKNWILSLTQDIEFDYNSVHGSVCPFALDDFSLAYGGRTQDFVDIDEMMAAPFFDGRSLNEIAEQIELY